MCNSLLGVYVSMSYVCVLGLNLTEYSYIWYLRVVALKQIWTRDLIFSKSSLSPI